MTGKLTKKTAAALIVTALVLIISLAFSAADTYAASGANYAVGKVKAANGTVLRKSAKNKGKKVAVLGYNSTLTVKKEVFTSYKKTSKKYRWYQVTASTGQSGYVRSDKVGIVSYDPVTAKAKSSITYRKGAGSAMKYKGKYKKGKQVTVVLKAKAKGSKKTWYKVKKGTKYYYIQAGKLNFNTQDSSKDKDSDEVPKIKNVKTESSTVTIDGITFTLSEIRYPEDLCEGNPFGITGLVIASTNMQKMEVGVKTPDGSWECVASTALNGNTGNIYLLDKDVKFGSLPVGTHVYEVVVTINGKQYTPISRQFTIKKPVWAQAITDKAFELAWPPGTASSVYKYPSGKPTDAYKNALNAVYPNRKWGAAPQVGASCDVFVGTVLRSCGYVPDMERGLSEQIPYLASSPKFRDIGYNGNRDMLQSGDIVLYNHYDGTHICIYVVRDGKAYIAEANYQGTYGRLEETEKGMNYRLKTSGKKYIRVYRAVE